MLVTVLDVGCVVNDDVTVDVAVVVVVTVLDTVDVTLVVIELESVLDAVV